MSAVTPGQAPVPGIDFLAVAAYGAHNDAPNAEQARAAWLRLTEDQRINWRAAVDAVRMLLGSPAATDFEGYWKARGYTHTGTEFDRDDLADAFNTGMQALRDGAPRCPNGCGCRLGTEDADSHDCACDGLCCYDEIEVSEVFAERDRLRAALRGIGEGDPVHGMTVRAALKAP